MICESERDRVAPHGSTWRTEWTAADDDRSLCLQDRYSSGIMSPEPPTNVSTACATLTLYAVLFAAAKSRATRSLKKKKIKRGKSDVARCNELRRPAKLLPSSAHPPYYGSSSVVENHFEGVSDEVGDLRSGNYNWIDVLADNAPAWSEKTL